MAHAQSFTSQDNYKKCISVQMRIWNNKTKPQISSQYLIYMEKWIQMALQMCLGTSFIYSGPDTFWLSCPLHRTYPKSIFKHYCCWVMVHGPPNLREESCSVYIITAMLSLTLNKIMHAFLFIQKCSAILWFKWVLCGSMCFNIKILENNCVGDRRFVIP